MTGKIFLFETSTFGIYRNNHFTGANQKASIQRREWPVEFGSFVNEKYLAKNCENIQLKAERRIKPRILLRKLSTRSASQGSWNYLAILVPRGISKLESKQLQNLHYRLKTVQ